MTTTLHGCSRASRGWRSSITAAGSDSVSHDYSDTSDLILLVTRTDHRRISAQRFDGAFAAAFLRRLLPAGLDSTHVGQFVRDTLVAIDAGSLLRDQEFRVDRGRAVVLPGEIHRDCGMTVPAFQGVIGLHPSPFVLGELEPMVQELVAGRDRAEDLAPDFL